MPVERRSGGKRGGALVYRYTLRKGLFASRLPHHSDRGSQYTSDAYQFLLGALGIECSMSRTGNCYDNAAMERFFWSLKHEWTKHESFADLEAARWSDFK